jgi:hypothetical protein
MKTISCSLVLGLLTFCGCQSPLPRTSADQASPDPRTASGGTSSVPDPLVSLNQLFLDGYKERLAVVKSNTSPLIVGNFNTVILYWNGNAETNRAIPDIYNALKTVAHVPFGIFVRVYPYATDAPQKIPAQALEGLKEYSGRIAAVEKSLPQRGYSPQQLARQREILSSCQSFLKSLDASQKLSRTDLLEFTHKLGPVILANANEAAAAQLDMTHAAVMAWKKRVPAEEWKRLVVVVRGPQMPRRLNIFTQYFARVLEEPTHNLGYPMESRRLIYAESIMKERDHMDLVATTFIDGDASEAFFGDRWRMSRDVLADGAEEHLRQMKFD